MKNCSWVFWWLQGTTLHYLADCYTTIAMASWWSIYKSNCIMYCIYLFHLSILTCVLDLARYSSLLALFTNLTIPTIFLFSEKFVYYQLGNVIHHPKLYNMTNYSPNYIWLPTAKKCNESKVTKKIFLLSLQLSNFSVLRISTPDISNHSILETLITALLLKIYK